MRWMLLYCFLVCMLLNVLCNNNLNNEGPKCDGTNIVTIKIDPAQLNPKGGCISIKPGKDGAEPLITHLPRLEPVMTEVSPVKPAVVAEERYMLTKAVIYYYNRPPSLFFKEVGLPVLGIWGYIAFIALVLWWYDCLPDIVGFLDWLFGYADNSEAVEEAEDVETVELEEKEPEVTKVEPSPDNDQSDASSIAKTEATTIHSSSLTSVGTESDDTSSVSSPKPPSKKFRHMLKRPTLKDVIEIQKSQSNEEDSQQDAETLEVLKSCNCKDENEMIRDEELMKKKANGTVELAVDRESFGVRLWKKGKRTYLKDHDGLINTPLYISFAEKKLALGKSAMKHLKKKNLAVVYDILKLCSLNCPLCKKYEGPFILSQDEDTGDSMVEVDTAAGRRMVTPVCLISIILLHALKLVQRVTGEHLKEMVIVLDREINNKHDVITIFKEAAELVKVKLVFEC